MQRVLQWFRKLAGDRLGVIVARGASSALTINVLSAGALFGANMVVANVLGAQSFGDYVYTIGWVNVFTLFTTLGLDTSAIRFVPIYTANAEWSHLRGLVRRSRLLVLAAGCVAGVVLGGAAWVMVGRIRETLFSTLLVGCFLLVSLSLLRLSSAQVQATKRIAQAHFPIYVLRPLMVAAAVAVLYALPAVGVSAPRALAANLVATTAALAVSMALLHRALPPQVHAARPQPETRRWFGLMVSFLLYSGFLYLMSRVDILMIGALIGTKNAGLYSVAAQVASLVVSGLNAVLAIAAPLFSGLHSNNRRAELRRVVRLASAGALAVALVSTAVLILAGPWVLRLFGPEFPRAYTVLVILCGGMFAFAVMGIGSSLMNMTAHHRQAAWLAALALVLNVVLNAVLIPRYGINGAAVATASATVLSNIMVLAYVLRNLELNPTLLPVGFLIRRR